MVEAKDFGVKKAITTNVSMGLTQFIIFGTYALAFWYGTKLSVDEPENYTIGRVITVSLLNLICFWIKIQQEKFLNNHQLCYFWSQVFFSVMIGSFSLGQGAPNLESIAKARGAAYEVYKTIDMVQIFSLCSIFTIKLFLYYMYAHIVILDDCYMLQPRPIDSSSKEGHKPDHVKGDIEFKNINFSYPSRKDVKVQQH